MNKETFKRQLEELVSDAKACGVSYRSLAEGLQATLDKLYWDMPAADRFELAPRAPKGFLRRLLDRAEGY